MLDIAGKTIFKKYIDDNTWQDITSELHDIESLEHEILSDHFKDTDLLMNDTMYEHFDKLDENDGYYSFRTTFAIYKIVVNVEL